MSRSGRREVKRAAAVDGPLGGEPQQNDHPADRARTSNDPESCSHSATVRLGEVPRAHSAPSQPCVTPWHHGGHARVASTPLP